MFQKGNAGFALWECLLVACVSMSIVFGFCRYWHYWVRALHVLFERALVIQTANMLPEILLAHWHQSSSQCDKESEKKMSVIDAKVYHQHYPQALLPISDVFMLRQCKEGRSLDKAYFLAHAKGLSGAVLYEKTDNRPAKALVSGVLFFACRKKMTLVSSLLIDCRYQLPWPMLSGSKKTSQMFHRLIPVMRGAL